LKKERKKKKGSEEKKGGKRTYTDIRPSHERRTVFSTLKKGLEEKKKGTRRSYRMEERTKELKPRRSRERTGAAVFPRGGTQLRRRGEREVREGRRKT